MTVPRPEGADAVEVLEHDPARVERMIPQIHVAGLPVDIDPRRSRFLRLGVRTFGLAFSRSFFGTGGDFEHLRGHRSLVAVLTQATPIDPGRFEAHRLVVIDLRPGVEGRLEVRRLDGSVAHVGRVRIEKDQLSASVSMELPNVPLAGTVTGTIRYGGQISVDGARLSLRTRPRTPTVGQPERLPPG